MTRWSSRPARLLFAISIAASVLLIGMPRCARATGPGPFFRGWVGAETLTQADAIRAAAILVGEREHVEDLAVCRKRLLDTKVLTPKDDADPSRILRKGFACLLFARAMKLDGGLKVRLLGWNQRFAFQELEFLEMVPPQGEHDRMTGTELASLLRSAQTQMKLEKKR